MNSLIFLPEKGASFAVKLNREKHSYTIEEVSSSSIRVYEDVNYDFELEDDFDNLEVDIYFNGKKIESARNGRRIMPNKSNENKTTFAGKIGFIQVGICCRNDNGEESWFYTDYISILIKSTSVNKSIKTMLDYIYENQEDILYDSVMQTTNGKNRQQSYDDFWSQIRLLEGITTVYESLYGYFKANCRTKLTEIEVVDRTAKLQNVDAKTIYFMAQHPEYLRRDVAGIEYRNQKFMPSKTLMLQNVISYDIYENQVVLSFLKKVHSEIQKLKQSITDYIEYLSISLGEKDGYILSSYIVYQNVSKTLKEFEKRTTEVENKIGYLYGSYKRILKDVKEIDLVSVPKPSPVFMSVPQYNRIYICIQNWYSKTGYNFNKERMMLGFFDGPSIYESYVLVKLINLIKSLGWRLIAPKKVDYTIYANWKHVQKDYNNTFVFENDGQKITLYYEPIIYDRDFRQENGIDLYRKINGIGLYRNNTNSLTDDEEERTGHYYVPDFVIKAELDNKEKYVICDAKYAGLYRVKTKYIPDLAYKYLLSISAVEDNMEIVGLNIIFGKPYYEYSIESLFDQEIPGTRKKEPFVNYMPLTEEISFSKQRENVSFILQKLLSNQ